MDFLIIILKGVISKYSYLKFVLMSATMCEDLFSEYFGGCLVILVLGYMYLVNEYYLEDILFMIGWGGVYYTSKKASGGGGGESRVRVFILGVSVDVMCEVIM